MAEKKKGPIILLRPEIRADLESNKLFELLTALISAGKIKASTQSFINAIYANSHYTAEATSNDGSFYRWFDACEYLHNQRNPDYQTDRRFKFSSRQSRYTQMRKLISLGLLKPFEGKRPDIYQVGDNRPTDIFELCNPDLALIQSIKPKEEPAKRTAPSKPYKMNEPAHMEVIDKPVSQNALGSMYLQSNYLSKCIRVDENQSSPGTLKSTFLLKHADNKELSGELKIVTSHSTKEGSQIMVAKDMAVVDYCYSAIRERIIKQMPEIINNILNHRAPFINQFRLTKSDILKVRNRDDSGGFRRIIDQQLERVFTTDFDLDGSAVPWAMQSFGFTDDNGEPLTELKEYKLLRRIGEQGDSKGNSPSQYMYVALPDHLFNMITRQLTEIARQTKIDTLDIQEVFKKNIFPIFERNQEILQTQHYGINWSLNNYLRSMVAYTGTKHGPIDLDKFCGNWYVWTNEFEGDNTELRLLSSLLSDDTALYVDGPVMNDSPGIKPLSKFFNSRGVPRISCLYALLDKDTLIHIETTKEIFKNTRLSSIKYRITAVRMNADQAQTCINRLIAIQKNPYLILDNETFPATANAIIESCSYGAKHLQKKAASA